MDVVRRLRHFCIIKKVLVVGEKYVNCIINCLSYCFGGVWMHNYVFSGHSVRKDKMDRKKTGEVKVAVM